MSGETPGVVIPCIAKTPIRLETQDAVEKFLAGFHGEPYSDCDVVDCYQKHGLNRIARCTALKSEA